MQLPPLPGRSRRRFDIMIRVKICGLSTVSDALAAVEAGADLLGFNFHPSSPRSIEIEACRELTSVLRSEFPAVTLIGVFVNRPSQDVEGILRRCHLDLAQLHGDESPEMVAYFRGRAFKAVRLSTDRATGEPLEPVAEFTRARAGRQPALLVDAASARLYGGSGQTADWSAAAELAQRFPLLLAGGLTPENVAAAVRQVQPWGADVASGVELAPGRKDPAKMRAFVQAVRSGAEQIETFRTLGSS